MEFTLNSDAFGRVVGTIAHNGEHAVVTGLDVDSALADLQAAVEDAVAEGNGECFWHEVAGDYRWLFRREGDKMRVVVIWSSGTLTGWEHRFWAECDAQEFGTTMSAAIKTCRASEVQN